VGGNLWAPLDMGSSTSAAPTSNTADGEADEAHLGGRSRKTRILDEEAFQNFAPLLAASQDYAMHSGCRFRSDSFSELPTDEVTSRAAFLSAEAAARRELSRVGVNVPGPHQDRASESARLVAKLRAAPTVRRFAERVRAGEPALRKELELALRTVMLESVRNAMIAAFRELEMWPPTPTPAGVDKDDCRYEDLSAALPELAQRAYNDAARREQDVSEEGVARVFRRAMTASYICDFGHAAGADLPPVPEAISTFLLEFQQRVTAWETEQQGYNKVGHCSVDAVSWSIRSAIENFGFGAGKTEDWHGTLWNTMSTSFIDVAASAGISLVRKPTKDATN